MKTFSTLLLTTLLAFTATNANAQSWFRDGSSSHSHYNSHRYKSNRPSSTRPFYRDNYVIGYTPEAVHPTPRYDATTGRTHSTSGYCPISIQAGYVAKRFVTNYGRHNLYREDLWGNKGAFMHGIQVGVGIQPTTSSGFGLRTGLFYEIYLASDHDGGATTRFAEHNLYIPLHVSYDIALGYDGVLNFHTGPGLNTVLAGVYRTWGSLGGVSYKEYGGPGRANRVNATWDFGASIAYHNVKIGFDYGLGLNDHEFYTDARTRLNKISLSAALVF